MWGQQPLPGVQVWLLPSSSSCSWQGSSRIALESFTLERLQDPDTSGWDFLRKIMLEKVFSCGNLLVNFRLNELQRGGDTKGAQGGGRCVTGTPNPPIFHFYFVK